MVTRKTQRRNGVKRKLQDAFTHDEEKEDEEYELEAIVGERVENGRVEYEIKWTNYESDENTWEPADHLTTQAINGWNEKKTASKQGASPNEVCPVCREPDDLGRQCETCKSPMHHFCSHDVCKSLNLVQDGVTIEEFNDVCYCSQECYYADNGRSLQSQSKRKSKGKAKSKDTRASEPAKTNDTQAKHAPERCTEATATDTDASASKGVQPKETQPSELPTEATTDQDEEKLDATALVGKRVAFSPAEESWMDSKLYKLIGTTYMIGIVSRVSRVSKKSNEMFEIRWTNTRFQGSNHVHVVPRDRVQDGIEKYSQLAGTAMHGETWEALCRLYPRQADEINIDDQYEVLENECVRYDEFRPRVDTHADVEGISSLEFEPNGVLQAPTDLYVHEDGSTETTIRPECRQQFEHSVSSSFLAYLPISFWKQVVESTNAYAETQKGTQVTLEEMMTFLGILFYMSLVDRGEYKNYWGEQVEDSLFGGGSTVGLDTFMTLRRFMYIRKNLCFRSNVTAEDVKRDPLARIRPLLNILKVRSSRFVKLGRNVAVDEASVACRS
jgi:hypothetical protein